MRLQVLELPQERDGDVVNTPYLLILSEVEEPDRIAQFTPEEHARWTGARGMLIFRSAVELGPPPRDECDCEAIQKAFESYHRVGTAEMTAH